MNGPNPIDLMYAALEAGDLAAAAATLAPDARVWHNFDQIALDPAACVEGWGKFVTAFPERSVHDVRRVAIDGGFLQQHVQVARLASGQAMAWPICVVVKVEDGLITRLDEYIDRAGSFAPAEGAVVTPGF